MTRTQIKDTVKNIRSGNAAGFFAGGFSLSPLGLSPLFDCHEGIHVVAHHFRELSVPGLDPVVGDQVLGE